MFPFICAKYYFNVRVTIMSMVLLIGGGYSMKRIVQLALLALLLPALCQGEENRQRQVEQAQSVIAPLSPELQQLFSREMLELQNAMMAMLPLYVAGKLDDIATIAARMESSYVLKKNLSGSQMHELHAKLPAAFIEQDQQFHYLAGMLEHVAKAGKTELVGFYISKMGEACVACHTAYATSRFPELSRNRQVEHDH
jgi:hypothetical protein